MISFKSFRNFSTLVLADLSSSFLTQSTLKLISVANKHLEAPVDLFVATKNETESKNLGESLKVRTVYSFKDNIPNSQYDSFSQAINKLIVQNNYKYVIGSTSTFSRSVIIQAAAKHLSQPISDIIDVIDLNTFKRNAYAGNAINTIVSKDKIKFLTLRPTSFSIDANVHQGKYEVKQIDEIPQSKIKHIEENLSKQDKVELSQARVIFSGGRALKSAENFKILEDLTKIIPNSAVGASRAAVDAGYVPNDLQIGQTGKVVAPELYFAIGISGAIQHVAGMKDSKVIVAINKDSEAPIFQISDYGLVGDLFKIVPELAQKIGK